MKDQVIVTTENLFEGVDAQKAFCDTVEELNALQAKYDYLEKRVKQAANFKYMAENYTGRSYEDVWDRHFKILVEEIKED